MEEAVPPPEARLADEVRAMKPSARRKRAKAAGAAEEEIEACDDADDPVAAFVELISRYETPPSAEELLAVEIGAMKPSARLKWALAAGATEEEAEEAGDADEPVAAYATLIARCAQKKNEAAHKAALAVELGAMKPSARKRRAVAAGATEDAIDEAMDADDPVAAFVDILLLLAPQPSAAEPAAEPASEPAAEPAAATELPHLAAEIPQQKVAASHAGAATSQQLGGGAFGDKHIMLSYQWGVQEQVKKARTMLTRRGVPCWMDVDGGMEVDIYDSMAKGVQNAACIVCFLTQEYQDSDNCALELKFAKQCGVPIVPVMLDPTWVAGGWLGLLTAGALWTPLVASTFEANIDQLVVQIKKAVEPLSGEARSDGGEDFSVDEVKSELDRLRLENEDATPRGQVNRRTSVSAKLPAAVPALPDRYRVSAEMEELLAKLLDPAARRVGFCGMGGIGKTVISSWLVRQPSVRASFSQICWIQLGQTPNIEACRQLLYRQLTGTDMDEDQAEEHKKEMLKSALQKQKVLLVLDDLWSESHEQTLNLIDDDGEGAGESKVLISSRVRGLLSSAGHDDSATHIVDIALPSEEDAVKMLLSTGGVSTDKAVPPEALGVVKFCNMLPLAIGIAGKLISELEMEEADDWSGVLSDIREEFEDSDSKTSVEEAVISTSLKAIRDVAKGSAVALFRALALVPEDVRCPLDVLSMVYEASVEGKSKRPSILNCRRWLKLLIDRSLVLGTVDRFQLHDIVRDFVLCQYTEDELAASHRRLVELLRTNRPVGISGDKEWDVATKSPTAKYIYENAQKHIALGINKDWVKDELMITSWLCDVPQDDLCKSTALALGHTQLATLLENVAESGDKWLLARLASVAASICHQGDGRSTTWRRTAMDALGELVEIAEDKHARERLELETLVDLLSHYDPADYSYLSRVARLAETEAAMANPVTRACLLFFPAMPAAFAGRDACGDAWMPFALAVADGCQHPDVATRALCTIILGMLAPFDSWLTHERWDWERVFGPGSQYVYEAVQNFDYDQHHLVTIRMFASDYTLVGDILGAVLANREGDIAAATAWMEKSFGLCQDRLLHEPILALHLSTQMYVAANIQHAMTIGRTDLLYTLMTKSDATWVNGEAFIDQGRICLSTFMRPRGDTTMGAHLFTAETFTWVTKLSYFLCSPNFDAAGVTEEEVIANVPSIAQLTMWHDAGFPGVTAACTWLVGLYNTFLLAAQVLEKCGRIDEALPYAEHAATHHEWATGAGSESFRIRSLGHCVWGRCLAARGKLEDAVQAFESGAQLAATAGWCLHEAQALRDMLVHAKADESTVLPRVKAVIEQMLCEVSASGGSAVAAEKLKALQPLLAPIDVAALFA